MKLKSIIIVSALLSGSLFARKIEMNDTVIKLGTIAQEFQESCDETFEFVRTTKTPERVNLSFDFASISQGFNSIIKTFGVDFNQNTIKKNLELSFTKARQLVDDQTEVYKIHLYQTERSARTVKAEVESQPEGNIKARSHINGRKIYFKYQKNESKI